MQQAELIADDGQANDYFGYSVAASNGWAVVGAPGANSGQGTVYLFTQSGTTWTLGAEVTASDGQPGDQFGSTVATNGATIVVGAPSAQGQGVVYVFLQPGGMPSRKDQVFLIQTAELTASDEGANDNFGTSAAVDSTGNIVVAGGPNHQSVRIRGQGAAYVFQQSLGTWSQTELTASDGAAGDSFGNAVAVDGGTAVSRGLFALLRQFRYGRVRPTSSYKAVTYGASRRNSPPPMARPMTHSAVPFP